MIWCSLLLHFCVGPADRKHIIYCSSVHSSIVLTEFFANSILASVYRLTLKEKPYTMDYLRVYSATESKILWTKPWTTDGACVIAVHGRLLTLFERILNARAKRCSYSTEVRPTYCLKKKKGRITASTQWIHT